MLNVLLQPVPSAGFSCFPRHLPSASPSPGISSQSCCAASSGPPQPEPSALILASLPFDVSSLLFLPFCCSELIARRRLPVEIWAGPWRAGRKRLQSRVGSPGGEGRGVWRTGGLLPCTARGKGSSARGSGAWPDGAGGLGGSAPCRLAARAHNGCRMQPRAGADVWPALKFCESNVQPLCCCRKELG